MVFRDASPHPVHVQYVRVVVMVELEAGRRIEKEQMESVRML